MSTVKLLCEPNGEQMSFYERYEKICKVRGIAPKGGKASQGMGCSRSSITDMSHTGFTPRGEIVAGAATMLGVSADYLLAVT